MSPNSIQKPLVLRYGGIQAGIRERERYRDITWLMPSVDLESIFYKFNIVHEVRKGDQIMGFCPDHHLYTGRIPSDPKWTINTVTGETFCFTEGRGSNIVWTLCRMLKKEPDDVAKLLTGKSSDADMAEFQFAAFQCTADRLWQQTDKKNINRPKIGDLEIISRDAESHKMSESAYQFFMQPPGKKYPTNISRETVDRYKVFLRTYGYYSDRVVIPYYMHGKICGYSAVDILGKEAWHKKHSSQDEKSYRKVLYPENFMSSECLFGYDDCQDNAEFIVVLEGAREVMKLTQEGFTNSVAILGAYISDKHHLLLSKKHPKMIVLMFDGDDAGVAITHRTAEALKRNFSGNSVVKCFLPKGRDPKTMDGNELRNIIEMAKKQAVDC